MSGQGKVIELEVCDHWDKDTRWAISVYPVSGCISIYELKQGSRVAVCRLLPLHILKRQIERAQEHTLLEE